MQKYALALLLFTGCVAEGPDISSGEFAIESQNKIALNKIALNKIALNKIALNGLVQANVADIATLVETVEGREVLAYFVQCALTREQTASFVDSAHETHTFAGAVGLAPNWLTAPPSASDRRWVSACLIARTNAYGVSVAISMRGVHAELVPSGWEASAYALREGAFWGDVFREDMIAVACPGPLKLAGSTASTLPLRECSVSTNGGVSTVCGHSYAGPCETACIDEDGIYDRCDGQLEVITTYVATE
jgi:hypothetical protein